MPVPFCDFAKYTTWDKRTSIKNSPPYGALARQYSPTIRCPKCRRRLKMKAIYCIGGEFSYWTIPAHKPRITRRPGPTRQSKKYPRGC